MKNKKYLLLVLPFLGLTACNGDAGTIKAKKYAPLSEEQTQVVTEAATNVSKANGMKISLSVKDISFSMDLKSYMEGETVKTKTAIKNFHGDISFQYESTDFTDITRLNAALEITNLGFSYTIDSTTAKCNDMTLKGYINNDYLYADISDTNLRNFIASIIKINLKMQGTIENSQIDAAVAEMMQTIPNKIKLGTSISSIINGIPGSDMISSLDLSTILTMAISLNENFNFMGVTTEGEDTKLLFSFDKSTLVEIMEAMSGDASTDEGAEENQEMNVVLDAIKYIGLELTATINSKNLLESATLKFEYSMALKNEYQDLKVKTFINIALNIDYAPAELVLPSFTDYQVLNLGE